MQLIMLTSLMLASKIYDYSYFSESQLHDLSDHAFTNKGIYLILLFLFIYTGKILNKWKRKS